MADECVQSRLSAILVADVVSYSRLAEIDGDGIRVRLKSLHAELVDPRIVADGGRPPLGEVSDAPSAPSRDPEPGCRVTLFIKTQPCYRLQGWEGSPGKSRIIFADRDLSIGDWE